MKLVEILAREWKEWPEDCTVVEQDVDGDICAHRDSTNLNYRHLGISITLAEDWIIAFVTRAQWEAERYRISEMDCVKGKIPTLDEVMGSVEFKDGRMYSKENGFVFVPEFILKDPQSVEDDREAEDWRNECQKHYEQELWDKVAVSALAKSIGAYPDDSTTEQVRYCFEYADAFMAERAKRMKK